MRVRGRCASQTRIMCLLIICIWSCTSVFIFWRKMKQYDQRKMSAESLQQPIQPVDVTLPLQDDVDENGESDDDLGIFADVSSAEDLSHYSGYEIKVSTLGHGRDTPTLKLRHIIKSKVDYGRDRDLDVEGVNDYLLWYENFQNNMPTLPTLPRQQKCSKPLQNVAFIKTHHTGSDVITNILNRYADLNYLNVALPSDGLPTFFWPMRFQWKYIDITMLNGSLPNIMSNHARYNNDVMDNILNPGSVYLTILRDPVTQLETTFNNLGFGGLLQVTNTSDQLLTFLKSPKYYIQEVIRRKRFKDTLNLIKNAQFFDLGLSTTAYHRKNVIKMTIQELYERFSLVLIYEFLDESLVLMKRRLCWQLDDILYLKFHYTNHEQWNRKEMTDELKERIKVWNQADVLLYDFFNRTLWKEIEYEGKHFWKEVTEFRHMQQGMEKTCVRSESAIPRDEKFALSDVPTTVQQLWRSQTVRSRVQATKREGSFQSQSTPTGTSHDHSTEISGDAMYIHETYKKPSKSSLRDVLVRSRVIRHGAKSSQYDGDKRVGADANNNLTFVSKKSDQVNSGSNSQAGNLYTDTNDMTGGSGTGKTVTTDTSTAQRLLSRTVTPWDTYLCKKLLMTEVEYLDYFRKKHVYGKSAQRK